MKRTWAAASLTALTLSLVLAGCGSNEKTEDSMVKKVVVHTTVTPGGQFPDYLDITLDDVPRTKMRAEDFSMKGHATNWMDPSLHDFEAGFSKVESKGTLVRLYFDGFKDKYFYVEDWEVQNHADESLSFDSSKIDKVETPVADDFSHHTTEDGEVFNYWLYQRPDVGEPLPLVVVFHGYGDTHNILACRTSVAWAEPKWQKEHPCYVLSPTIADSDYNSYTTRKPIYDAIHEKIGQMIKQGMIDSKRVYVMGNSFGGLAVTEYLQDYPDDAAGAMALCSALNYSPGVTNDLSGIKRIPMRLFAAEHDGTIPSGETKKLCQKLTDLGALDVEMKIYSDEEMNAAGAENDNHSTFSYHHVEMAVMEDSANLEWMFAQVKR